MLPRVAGRDQQVDRRLPPLAHPQPNVALTDVSPRRRVAAPGSGSRRVSESASKSRQARDELGRELLGGSGRAGRSALPEAAHDKRANLGDAVEIGVDVHHAQSVMERCDRNQEVGDGRAMPHAMVMGEVAL